MDSRKETVHPHAPGIALALGSGSARGWAHVGVIRALEEADVRPDIICGTSIGALVGAAYLSGRLDALEDWVRALAWWDIVRFMDLSLKGGGFIAGERLMEYCRQYLDDTPIENLPRRFAAVATELATGREIWFQDGPLRDAVRASMALPGLFAPVKLGDEWIADGGLVNPVPVSLCRAMGARVVIAVDLNGDIVGRHLSQRHPPAQRHRDGGDEADLLDQLWTRLNVGIKGGIEGVLARKAAAAPSLFAVLASSINIMQDRITRSRMAGDPPDVLVTPRLGHIALLDFARAEESIAEGKASVERMLPAIRHAVEALA